MLLSAMRCFSLLYLRTSLLAFFTAPALPLTGVQRVAAQDGPPLELTPSCGEQVQRTQALAPLKRSVPHGFEKGLAAVVGGPDQFRKEAIDLARDALCLGVEIGGEPV